MGLLAGLADGDGYDAVGRKTLGQDVEYRPALNAIVAPDHRGVQRVEVVRWWCVTVSGACGPGGIRGNPSPASSDVILVITTAWNSLNALEHRMMPLSGALGGLGAHQLRNRHSV